MIKPDPATSITKQANKLKVHKKTVRTVIKQDLSPDFNPLDYATWGILENKINATSHANIGSLETAIKWNKMSEEFIWSDANHFECVLIQSLKKMVTILSKFTVLCLSSYLVVSFFN